MATNTFKRLTKQNISNNSGSPSTIYTAATNKTSIVIGCLLCNKLSSQVTASVYIDTAPPEVLIPPAAGSLMSFAITRLPLESTVADTVSLVCPIPSVNTLLGIGQITLRVPFTVKVQFTVKGPTTNEP